MQYQHVCLESFGYTLPEEVITSTEIERRLAPLYARLQLPAGRLELMTGIQSRRFWPPGTLPSSKSIESGEKAITASGIDRRQIGALIHGSVCRDVLEPATACRVHHGLDLRANATVFDISNACLGLLNGIVQVANMIELGQIRAGLVVGTEVARPLVETTIDTLNRDLSLTRGTIKPAIASLTIGSASAAVLLCDRDLSRTGNRLLAATALANSDFHGLCRSDRDEAVAAGMEPLMATDSEQLMREGIATGERTFTRFLDEVGWSRDEIDRSFCHQVGLAHRKRMLKTLQVDPETDYVTVDRLGNTGSVALPITMGLAIDDGYLRRGNRVAMLGIGSGINSLMLGVRWQRVPSATAPDRLAVLARFRKPHVPTVTTSGGRPI